MITRPGTADGPARVQARMIVRRFAVLIAVSAAVTLAGCAGRGATSAPSAPGAVASAPSAPGAAASAAAPPGASTEPSAGQPAAKGSATITGTVSAGVEAGCLVLQDPQGQHVLVFDDPGLRAQAEVGATITVTGRAEPTQLTTCQQGVPFNVTAVRAN
ncbi:MAG: hypothetical protein QOE51_4100 [Actinoplanes sp.]|nr:hypothetical protein [Actinoplanes sp.]